jgi:hypothetical protein
VSEHFSPRTAQRVRSHAALLAAAIVAHADAVARADGPDAEDQVALAQRRLQPVVDAYVQAHRDHTGADLRLRPPRH